MRGLRHTIVNARLLELGETQIRKFDVEYPLIQLRQILTLSHLRGRMGLDLATERRESHHFQEKNLAVLEAILQRMREEVKTWGGTFMVVYLPAWDRYHAPHTYKVYRDDVLNMLEKHNIPVVDLHPAFEKQQDVWSLFHFGLDGHYNKMGAQLVAGEVRKSLQFFSQ